MFTALLITAASLAPNANAFLTHADQFTTELVCRDARPIFDAGYRVVIRTGGRAGLTEAILSEQSIMGPRELARYAVKKGRRAATVHYKTPGSDDFTLSLIHARDPGHPVPYIPATFVAEVDGARVAGSLKCQSVSQRPIPGHAICMAYWSGWEMDLDTGACVKRGRSGCSNPFEFETEAECKAAYFTEIQ